MGCEVCLSEEKDFREGFILRTFDLSPEEIEVSLRGLDFKLEVTLSGVDILFEKEEDWRKAREKVGINMYSTDTSSMEEVVGRLLKRRGETLSTAESCTGGLLSARIVNVPGSSEYFLGGVVVYSNQLKVKLLGVKEETLNEFGAVSRETCLEMLEGLRKKFGTDAGIAITGVAGPGGSDHKPEGLTYIGVYYREKFHIEERVFGAGRNPNRFLSSQVAFNELRKLILEEAT
ncbi:nicotinamide-nucleotide amidase [Hydrogenivirga caldilitoris]|uniref:Nicotinamide-nucleotide amidase n=1 Tax=Hydrogenivirga caldilitoris TaxID=246264 RepID=A0A497XQ75_9AQUI|nr:nicotinamide-nucleotide amidohydrolase family protein [Hydrogenivirga caldilitoris]RLJ71136.1 nicotinamide-nucleotide amidase [Hydrogenivirga caldilitoris]